jgi:hypothetical protein
MLIKKEKRVLLKMDNFFFLSTGDQIQGLALSLTLPLNSEPHTSPAPPAL